MQSRRSRAREVALQLLYGNDVNPGLPRPTGERFALDRLREPSLVQFALGLYDGVTGNRLAMDQKISAAAQNWRLGRMAVVDRNVLRLGAFEVLRGGTETPPAVAINEAIELARRYGSRESPAFVNGVLDRLRRDAGRPGGPVGS